MYIYTYILSSTSPLSKIKSSLSRPLMCTTVAPYSGEFQEKSGRRKRGFGPTMSAVVSFCPHRATLGCSGRNLATFHQHSPGNNPMSLRIAYGTDLGLIHFRFIHKTPLQSAVWSKGRARTVQYQAETTFTEPS